MELPPELFSKQYGEKEHTEKKQPHASKSQEKLNNMKCPACGEAINIDAKFCRYCGVRVNQITGKNSSFYAEGESANSAISIPQIRVSDEAPKQYSSKKSPQLVRRQAESSAKHQSVQQATSVKPIQRNPVKRQKTSMTGCLPKAVIAIIVLSLLISVASNKKGSDKSSSFSSDEKDEIVYYETASSHEKDEMVYYETAKKQFDKGDLNGALGSIVECLNQYPDSKEATRCEELYEQLLLKVKDNEPENGQTLERTFQYMGGCVFRVTAESGPALITISDKSNPSAYARFYVQKGQTAEINVTGGTYRVEYIIGYLWLDDEIGFGDFYKSNTVDDDVEFKSESYSGWVSHDTIEVTV